MKQLLCALTLLAFLGSAQAQTAPPAGPKVTFPTMPVIPPPAPQPGQAQLLGTDQMYIVQASAPVVVLTSPLGVLKVTPEKGPIRIRGKFVDGVGTESRDFPGPFIYIVEATGAGQCELIVVTSLDPKDPKGVDRRTLTTEIKPPEPPPGPGPGPGPGPTPVIPIPSDKLRVLCIWESGQTLTAKQLGVLNSAIWKNEVTAVGGEERVFDKDTNLDAATVPQFWKDAIKRTRASIPWVIISSPKGFYEGPLPATVADMQAAIKKVSG